MIFSHVANIKAKSTSTAFSHSLCFWGYWTGCLKLTLRGTFQSNCYNFGRNDISKNEATIGDKIVETLYSNRV